MKSIGTYLLAAFLFCLIFLSLKPTAGAQSLNIYAVVGDIVTTFQGYTSPGALVTFKETGVVIGTTVSDSTGYYSKDFVAQSLGPHTVTIYATDTNNDLTSSVALSYVSVDYQYLTFTNTSLPPTMVVSGTFQQGQPIFLSGQSKPNSVIRIEISGHASVIAYETTDADGIYSVAINTDSLGAGDYELTTELQFGSTTSTRSTAYLFSMTNRPTPTQVPGSGSGSSSNSTSGSSSSSSSSSVSSNATPTPAPRQTASSESFCPYEFARLCFFDKAKRGTFAFDAEFNEYLAGFIKNFLNTIDNAFDINEDELVDARDFSIVLYHVRSSQYPILGVTTSNSTEPTVLAAQSDTLNFAEGTSPDDGFLMDKLFTLIKIEIMVGIPLFIAFVILVIAKKRYVEK